MKIYMNRVLSSVGALMLMTMAIAPATSVAAGGYSIPSGDVQINVVGTTVTISGVALADPYVGNENQQHMGVDWTGACSAGSSVEFGFDTFTTGVDDKSFTGTWSTVHDFGAPGNYDVCVKVYHQNFNGAEGSDVATFTTTIVVPATYSVVYNDNGSTSGTAPTDANAYLSGATVTVLGNTGNLEKTGYTFAGWNTSVNGNETTYAPGQTFVISAAASLYAVWTPVETGSITVKKSVVGSDGVTDVADDQAFTVTLDGGNAKSVAEGSDVVYSGLAPGTYTVAELANPNYTYVSGAGSVEVVAGEETIVTIVNKQNEVVVPTGSITICKIVLDAEGNVITGAEGTTFTISGLTPDPETAQGAPHGILPNSIFNTPLVLNQKILAASEGNDAECKIYDGLTLDTVGNTGGYYYGQEQIESALEWLAPKYNEQWSESVLDLEDFYAYDGALFDEDSENDGARNMNADGHVTLSTQRPDRTLVVLNQLKSAPVCDAEASQTIVSDTLTLENGDASVPVSPINAAWTAAISGATWIWGENPISDSIATTSQTFTRTFDIVGTPTGATLNIAADNTYSVSINGTVVGSDLTETNYKLSGQDSYVIPAELLVSGANTITITVTNIGLPGSTPLNNPAGLLYKLVVTNNECEVPPLPVCSDKVDNDNDGLTDAADPACHTDGDVNNPESYDEDIDSEVNESAACSDGLDNDGDELIDRLDPNCLTDGEWDPQDDDESSPTTPPADVCSNIEGTQETVPSGYVANDGVCEEQRSSGGGGSRRSSGSVLGASTGEVLGASCGLYMDRYLKLGAPTNDEVQVIKLQAFLNTEGLFNRVPTGVYDMRTHNAVKDFQEKYFADILTPWGLTGPTGLVYLTTLNKINMIECPELMLQVPALTPWTSTTNTKFAQ